MTYTLDGPMANYDPRVTPIRGDLAELSLAGRLFAPHYVEPQVRMVTAPTVSLRARPAPDATAVSQLVHGERFHLLDIAGGWAWGYGVHDRYLGYLAVEHLGEPGPAATHAVTARAALVFANPDIKSMVADRLPMGARITAQGTSKCGKFLETAAGFVSIRHAEAIGAVAGDPVDLARRLMGAPYLWGGRSGDGLDCSGLVQMIFGLLGIDAERDTDQQAASLGEPIAAQESLQRGDLVYFPGHVGLMTDGETMIHANAYWMQVVEEPLAAIVERIDAEQPIVARRRMIP